MADRNNLEKHFGMSAGYVLNFSDRTFGEFVFEETGAEIHDEKYSDGTIGNNLAELRELYGTGHGKHGSSTGLKTRHAKLAIGAAATFAVFLFETHKETNV